MDLAISYTDVLIGKRAFGNIGGTCTMMRSLWSGVSGLKTHQMEMDVIGNNIANVNTTSYKSQATGFKDVMYQTVREGAGATQTTGTTNKSQVGLGTRMGSIYTNITSQGSAITTNNVFDLMITGDAFFAVSEAPGTDNWMFTRDGALTIDGSGNLVTQNDGYYLGFVAGVGIAGGGAIISDKTKVMPGTATGEAYFKGNIDKDDEDLVEGKDLRLNVYGNDGKEYTIVYNLTDAADNDDSTYQLDLSKVLDENGNKLDNIGNDSLILTYNRHDGTLEGISSKRITIFTNAIPVTDDQGVVVENNFVMAGPFVVGDFTRTVTGKDGETYTLHFSVPTSSDPECDYDFSIDYITDKYGNRIDFEDKKASFNFDDDTGTLLTINGEAISEVIFDFEDAVSYNEDGTVDKKFDLGTTTIDFSEVYINVPGKKGYTYHFTGDADVLGDLYVDFSNTHNYATVGGGHFSTIYGYKGNTEGLNKGYPTGDMTGISISDDGTIYGRYSNGESQVLAQLIFARFNNAMGLEKVGNNMYKASLNSGQPMWGYVNENGGYLSSGVLEGSNVDLAKEFTDMITTQRGFQANSKVITTSDEMLQILRGLKR